MQVNVCNYKNQDIQMSIFVCQYIQIHSYSYVQAYNYIACGNFKSVLIKSETLLIIISNKRKAIVMHIILYNKVYTITQYNNTI